MREEKNRLEAASEELDRRSRYLSSLVRLTRLAEEEEEDKDQAKPRQPQEEEESAEKAIDKCAGERDEQPQVRVRAADMLTAMQGHAFRCAREALAAMPKLDSKRLALSLKKCPFCGGVGSRTKSMEFDLTYGLAWHCIVGTSFGSYVTHSVGGFVYFSIDKVHVLLFKTAVEPLGNQK